jgi:hypothetical protein
VFEGGLGVRVVGLLLFVEDGLVTEHLNLFSLILVFCCGGLTRCDSSNVKLRLERRRGPILEERLFSFTEEDIWPRLVGE